MIHYQYINDIYTASNTSFRSTPAPLTGLEPAYSSYAFNDRLEGGDDTGARYVTNFLFRLDTNA